MLKRRESQNPGINMVASKPKERPSRVGSNLLARWSVIGIVKLMARMPIKAGNNELPASHLHIKQAAVMPTQTTIA